MGIWGIRVGMMGMQENRDEMVGIKGIRVIIRGIRTGMWGIGMGIRGIVVEMQET